MKHSDWLRLQTEGDRICATLRQQGYKCHKQTRRLSWKLGSLDQGDYIDIPNEQLQHTTDQEEAPSLGE
ncbi:hypothetical protein [Allocoleopsis franciscana]|uniref:Uncharacterized protein n=1 Tax=Allocoleopsis franciscana PCC 7113 TaxID=1173027 RepID=K9WN91_9CYAN|nr:hypothetical protein [Allocoleopsis franciscana]AFZ21271.1 hypothetical protein Mic7113_5643 [Allocoleopsis franciscana PCC 7113]